METHTGFLIVSGWEVQKQGEKKMMMWGEFEVIFDGFLCLRCIVEVVQN